jgi:hypothetical protein
MPRDGRPLRPKRARSCAAGCGRTARRLIRVTVVDQLVDPETGETLDFRRVRLVPYCNTCTPRGPDDR